MVGCWNCLGFESCRNLHDVTPSKLVCNRTKCLGKLADAKIFGPLVPITTMPVGEIQNGTFVDGVGAKLLDEEGGFDSFALLSE